MKKKTIRKGLLILGLLAVIVGERAYFDARFRAHRRAVKTKLKQYRRVASIAAASSSEAPLLFPRKLASVPFAENIVCSVKEVKIRGVFAPYNASIHEAKDGYHLFFRYDVVRQMHSRIFDSHIGYVHLDKNFEQTKQEFIPVETKTTTAEDPRIISLHNRMLVSYNDLLPLKLFSRSIHLAEIDLQSGQATDIQNLDIKVQQVEKNWVPFVYENELYFEHRLFSPRKVVKVGLEKEKAKLYAEPIDKGVLTWKWGTPRGGTPARLVEGEYLSFFHSCFTDERGLVWYVMGAYTFEAQPPFRITAVSSEPILFRGIYESDRINTADPAKFVIFPCGFAIDGSLLHLSCGENDGAVKIITMDQKALLRSLTKI